MNARLYPKFVLTLVIIFCLSGQFICGQYAVDTDGDVIVREATPGIYLFDNWISEQRFEGALFEENDNIYVSALRGDLILSADFNGNQYSADITINGINGYVGIGTEFPQHELDVNGSLQIGKNNRIFMPASTGIYTSDIFMNGSDLILANYTSEDIRFGISNSPGSGAITKMAITTDGVAIKSSYAPFEDFEVAGSGRAFFGDGNGSVRRGLLIDGDEGSFGTRIESYDYGTGSGINLLINTVGHGKVGIDVNSPTHVLHINGVGRSNSTTWSTSSDRRVKENIRSISNALDKIDQLNPVIFDWIESYKAEHEALTDNRYGFIAQEVQDVIPQMVTIVEEKVGDKEIADFHLLNNDALLPLLVKAMQEQQAIIKQQSDQIEDLKRRMADLEDNANN